MAIVKPFKGLRPPKNIAAELSCLPYDVMNTSEAKAMSKGLEHSLLNITRSEIECAEGVDVHSEEVYSKSVSNFKKFQEKGWLVADQEDNFYIYAQTMNGRTQYGLVGVASVEDYLNGIIKKHELTRKDKEEDRMVHVRINNANIEPVFFAYPAVNEIDDIIFNVVKTQRPEYDFVSEDGFGHHFWVVRDRATVEKIENLFKTKVPYTYVADGHHRTAAAALVGAEKRDANPNHNGSENYNFFLAVHFPENQLNVLDYNRLVKDLNGISTEEFIKQLSNDFNIEVFGHDILKPKSLHHFTMYLDGKWYSLIAKSERFNDVDPIERLDVSILSTLVLDNILGIKDLRTDKRIDFVGGIRGLGELSKRVDSGEMAVAFALYPVSMAQLITIADTGNIMPPKSTWFEPKLRSGLVIHTLD